MVFYLLSWEIFIIVTTQTYFCDLLNISVSEAELEAFPSRPDSCLSPHPLLMETPG